MTNIVNNLQSSLMMEMESPSKQRSISGTPLNLITPERMNQQRLPQSPSLHSYLNENEPPRHRDSTSSDVQSKVAFLNNLTGNTSPTRQPRGAASQSNNAALQRAILGYEEAQATLASVTAENDRMKSQMAASQKRERMIAERIESLMEEFQAERHKRSADKEIYVKEIKKARKETYKAEFGQVEAREELKEARNEIKRVAGEIAPEKEEKEKARQEAFERAYALAGVMEEMEVLKEKLKAVEQERDSAILQVNAYSMPKKEPDFEASELPRPDSRMTNNETISEFQWSTISKQGEDTDLTPKPTLRNAPKHAKVAQPIKLQQNSRFAWLEARQKEMELFQKLEDGKELTSEEEIRMLRFKLKRAEEKNAEDKLQMHMFHMLCQFKMCPCQVAEREGKRFVQDVAWDRAMQEHHIAKKRKLEEDAKFNQLPPDPTPEVMAKAKDESPAVDEVVEVPLPEPDEMELSSHIVSPNATAQLEEITQVIVERGDGTKPFSFSTSTSSHKNAEVIPPPLKHTQSSIETLDNDLFNLSPPKRAHPPRPSTSMGVLTLKSPIRLVPDSPQTSTIPKRSQTPTESKSYTQSTTTRVALKDSPGKQHRRTQSRPNIRSQSRGRSPLITTMSTTDDMISPSASPASTTNFPITPLLRQSRSHHNLSNHGHIHSPALETTTTTVRIPLRGLDGDDMASSEMNQGISVSRSNLNSLNVGDQDLSMSIPGTPVSREAALAQIRARRDRARSVNLKTQAGGMLGLKHTPVSAKRGVILDRGRDVSQASAPGRFGL